jgi:hypothetical protein
MFPFLYFFPSRFIKGQFSTVRLAFSVVFLFLLFLLFFLCHNKIIPGSFSIPKKKNCVENYEWNGEDFCGKGFLPTCNLCSVFCVLVMRYRIQVWVSGLHGLLGNLIWHVRGNPWLFQLLRSYDLSFGHHSVFRWDYN